MSIDGPNPYQKRFKNEQSIPVFRCGLVPHDHPDLDKIKQAYANKGSGIAVDYSLKFEEKS